MGTIPSAVLSEHFQERLAGRRLHSLVFVTYRFDPAFFEREVLPVFFDIPLSHAAEIRLVQLENAIPSVPGGIAVYYDHGGLHAEAGSARLDVRRIAVRHKTGIFHPKNVFALVEDEEPDDSGNRSRALLVACMSANLTRAGWWENVEVCHVEEIGENDYTRLRDDLNDFLQRLATLAGEKSADDHAALKHIRQFLKKTDQRVHRSTGGRMHPHFFSGKGPLTDFLSEAAGRSLMGCNLEVISPYFDGTDWSRPLDELIQRFSPRDVLVFLPRNGKGEALCSPGLHAWAVERGVTWGSLPRELMRRGKGEDALPRTVHAKVYRFFDPRERFEVLFVGSANLTNAAHQNGGNLETGFLVQTEPASKPDWWMVPEGSRKPAFAEQIDGEDSSATSGTRLSLRYWWGEDRAEAYWDDREQSPCLDLCYQELKLGPIAPLPPQAWVPVSPETANEIGRVLKSTSVLTVVGDGPRPALLLVQEEGMENRPSLLLDLSPSEILRYWSLLTAEQKQAFLEARAPEIALLGEGAFLVTPVKPLSGMDTLFDRFAGVFHAFNCLERSVRSALAEGREREADYRLFGNRYDTLGRLLERVLADHAEGRGDAIDQYMILLCARQLQHELQRDHREYFRTRRSQNQTLSALLKRTVEVRKTLISRNPGEMRRFLPWFDKWFLKRPSRVREQSEQA